MVFLKSGDEKPDFLYIAKIWAGKRDYASLKEIDRLS